MKKIIIIFLLFVVCSTAISQIKQRSTSVSLYTGIGYKFVLLTNSQARDAYPFFQLSNGDFLKEIDGYFGAIINESYGIEFSPSYLFTNTINSKGFSFNDGTGSRFYVPADKRLFALPLNLKFKYYPMAKNYGSSLSRFYLGVGAGPMYINEQATNQIYSDASQLSYLGSQTSEDSFWTSNFELMAGIGSYSKIGYGFEISYRIVPLKASGTKPLITNIVSNFGSVNFAANIIYSF